MLESGREGTLALSLALGHEMGIFDVIMACPEPMTSHEIAEKGKLKERYVREWLGCMVAAEVVQAQRGTPERYYVAEDHKGFLDKIGIGARLFASYAVRYNAVKACFRQDGPQGVSHEDFPDIYSVFHVMRQSSAASTVDTMLPLVPGLGNKLDEGIDVVDFGCGTGVLVREMARRFPGSRFHGSDISEQCISVAERHLAESGLSNVTFSRDDVMNLPDSLHGRFDWALTYDVIHDLPQPGKALEEISRCLRPGGVYVMADLHTPRGRCGLAGDDTAMELFGLSTFLCLPASAGEGGHWGPGAAWSVEEAQALVRQVAGLELVETASSQPYFAFHLCRKKETTEGPAGGEA